MIITLIPCIRDIALNGRRALRVRMVLNAWIPPAPSREAVKLMRDTYHQSTIGKRLVLKVEKRISFFCLWTVTRYFGINVSAFPL